MVKLPKVVRATFKCCSRKKYTKITYVNVSDICCSLFIITTIIVGEFIALLLTNREDGILNMLSPPT